MVNTRKAGQRIELMAQHYLEQYDWIVQRAPPSQQWNKQVDLFGLFDFIAIKGRSVLTTGSNGHNLKSCDNEPRMKFIQVKSGRLPTTKEKQALKAFKDEYCPVRGSVEWWCYWKRGQRKNKQRWEMMVI